MRSETLVAPSAPTLARAKRFLREALSRGNDVVTLRAPVASDVAVAWGTDDDALLWDPPEGPALAGVGTARTRSLSGPGRFGAVDGSLAGGTESREPGVVAPPPRVFGGFAFVCGGASTAPWEELGDGLFVLPRWVYGKGPTGAWLRYHRGDPSDAPVEELESMWQRLTRFVPLTSAVRVDTIDPPPRSRWRDEVEAIRADIRTGRLEKAVAATRAVVELDAPLDPRVVLHRLRRRFGGCTRFAIRRRGTTFLGATPERLLTRTGNLLRTEALAGSAAPGCENALLASLKDRHEQALVVQAITAALEPFTTKMRWSDVPVLHRLPNVVHLRTPIEARVDDVPTLRLVEALHPTPAVGGVPTREALELISAHEEPRGWYAAPFGWIDAQGDGSFVVGLRSGVLREQRAWAFAGCGIVAGSEPDAEHDEARMKLRAFLGALSEG